jgi:hypothetical protein
VSLTFVVDVTLGLLAVIAASVLQRRVNRRPPMDLDDEVVARDLASALRAFGAAITILGLLPSAAFRAASISRSGRCWRWQWARSARP